MSDYRICARCVMDTTDPDIVFDENGVCNHCKRAEERLSLGPHALDARGKSKALMELVDVIKNEGKGKRYDCVIGLSGGVDSSYVALKVKELGLRPIAAHLDNGWDSELSVQNIENICKRLEIDLFTEVLDWEEFKDLQLSFLKASTPDSEIPSDHAIAALLYKVTVKEGLRWILSGVNGASESILPAAWSQGYDDWLYIKSVQRAFGKRKLRTFPHKSLLAMAYYTLALRIRWVDFLDYYDYDKETAKREISDKLGWRNYGRKHGESHYTKIFQEYLLPTKFGYDKRRAHFSSLIVSGQMTRDEALAALTTGLYESGQKRKEDIDYLINKFGISRDEFAAIMAAEKRTIHDYPNYGDTWYYRLAKRLYQARRKR